MATTKYVLINNEKVGESTVRDWLEFEGKQAQEGLSLVRGVMEKLLGESKLVGGTNPTVTSILGRVEMIRMFVGTVSDSLLPIPTGLTPTELLEHPDVVKRRVARTKLRLGSFLRLEHDPKTAQVDGIVELLRELIVLHKTPNVQKEKSFDAVDELILKTRQVTLNTFEIYKPTTTHFSYTKAPTGYGHGSLLNLFGAESKPMELIREMERAIDHLHQLQSGLLALTSE